MYQIVYISSAVKPFSKQELLDLLNHSRSNNQGHGLTGMLLYKDGNIMQVLEGEKEIVEKRFNVIRHDPRHKDVIVIDTSETPQRQFGEWSMGFRDLNDPELKNLPGYSQTLNKSLVIEDFSENPSSCKELLAMFANS